MTDAWKSDRREFTTRSLMAALGGVIVTVSGCGGGGGGGGGGTPTGASPMPTTDGVSGTISANHGHVAHITSARLAEGGMIALDIRGQATHTHTVELSGEDVATIAGGQRVVTRSSNNESHFHEVTFN